jgi:hypothetical protein
MADRDVPPGFDHVGDMVCGFLGRLILILYGLVLRILDQRVAANSDDGDWAWIWAHVGLLFSLTTSSTP